MLCTSNPELSANSHPFDAHEKCCKHLAVGAVRACSVCCIAHAVQVAIARQVVPAPRLSGLVQHVFDPDVLRKPHKTAVSTAHS